MHSQQQQLTARGLSGLYQQARSKAASYVGPSYTDPASQAKAKRTAFLQLLRLMGLGAAIGGGTRAMLGARNLLRDTQVEPTVMPQPIMLRGQPDEDDREKRSQDTEAKPWYNFLAKLLPRITTTRQLGDWWGPTAGIAAAGSGLYGGWKLTDWLLNREREGLHAGEVDTAKEEYQKALADQYSQAMQAKNADDSLGIDDLYDVFEARSNLHEKKASPMGWVNTLYNPTLGHDNVQGAKGVLLAMMALLAGGTGAATYNYTVGQSKRQLLHKAIQMRSRQRAAKSPSPLYSIVDTPPGLVKEKETDELQYAT